MRTLAPATQAALAASNIAMVLLVEMDTVPPLYVSNWPHALTIGGVEYLGTAGLGRVDAVQDTPAEIKSLAFTLSGVPSAAVAMALGTPVQGKAVRIKVAVLDADTHQVLEVLPRWAGRLDVMALDDGQPNGTIRVTAEHGAIDLVRAATSTYSHTEQQRLQPGDMAFQYMNDQAEQQVVWPAASWGRK